jgi:hypothetical protein
MAAMGICRPQRVDETSPESAPYYEHKGHIYHPRGARPTLLTSTLTEPVAEGRGLYIGSFSKPEHTGLGLACHRDAPNGRGVA